MLEGCCDQIGEGHDRRIPPGATNAVEHKGFLMDDLKSLAKNLVIFTFCNFPAFLASCQ